MANTTINSVQYANPMPSQGAMQRVGAYAKTLDLQSELDAVDMALSALQERLETVLLPDSPEVAGISGVPVNTPGSDLTETINRVGRRLVGLTDRINAVSRRVDL